ncbi:LysM peptidoglycan-binding domain-containing protein [Bacillus sp. ISL-18]|uniref:3D domain-containing protein n=1 Tax=Bacillus sp. ISL-18 TaxID=2819118 RepID=UPI001BE72DD4|nr:3D domain-containing protein [Bacillus sp. ISL-18]MBT2656204.1 LysM peptidoglycan-binding domain-containing protein [Bacillus sp. ISL-18]
MIKKIKAFLAVAALSGTVGANVHAEEITVKEGDTLWDLSQVHNTSVEDIQNWNHLSTNLIHPGDVLTIATEKQYTVQQDDTLGDIALTYQVQVNQIKDWNKLNTDLIHPGLKLIIYDEVTDSVKNAEAPGSKEENTVTSNLEKPVANSIVTSTEPKKTTIPATASAPQPATTVQVVEPAKTVSAAQTTQQAPSAHPAKAASSEETDGKEITVKATAYTASCEGCSGTTATGVDLKANPDAKVIAVDPKVIPLGSKVYVEGYGVATAADTGGAIKGNRIDVFISTEHEALKWGNKHITIKIID